MIIFVHFTDLTFLPINLKTSTDRFSRSLLPLLRGFPIIRGHGHTGSFLQSNFSYVPPGRPVSIPSLLCGLTQSRTFNESTNSCLRSALWATKWLSCSFFFLENKYFLLILGFASCLSWPLLLSPYNLVFSMQILSFYANMYPFFFSKRIQNFSKIIAWNKLQDWNRNVSATCRQRS